VEKEVEACTVAARASVVAMGVVAWTGRPCNNPCSHSQAQRSDRMCSIHREFRRSVTCTEFRIMAVPAAGKVAAEARAARAATVDWVAERVAKVVTAVVEARAEDMARVAEAWRAAVMVARAAAMVAPDQVDELRIPFLPSPAWRSLARCTARSGRCRLACTRRVCLQGAASRTKHRRSTHNRRSPQRPVRNPAPYRGISQ